MLADFIRTLRKKRDLTQEYIADKLGLTRQTYSQIEHGDRELTISEAKILADVFDISLQDLLDERDRPLIVEIEEEKKRSREPEPGIRISVPQRNLAKFKEVLLYILSKVGGKPNVGETVLYKLLYFIDFDYYEKYEEQLIGATYIKNNHGPTPVEFKMIVDDMIEAGELVRVPSRHFGHDQKKYLPVRDPDLSVLENAREIAHINSVLARLSDSNATELSRLSHLDVPWIIAEKLKPIDYEAVFYRTAETSARHYDDDRD
jgi:transcriptional regulator with XRE-family HTH domain